MIFETERLLIRKFEITDIVPFHEMQKNPNVMKYTDSITKTYDEDVLDLKNLIANYEQVGNRFWVWAIIRKADKHLLGSVAIIDYDEEKDEVGFRFLEKYWNNGYGFEVLKGLLKYAKLKEYKELYAEVYAKNVASEIILKKVGFTFIKEHFCERTKFLDRLYIIRL